MAKLKESLFRAESIAYAAGLGDKSSYFIIANAYLYTCDNNLIYGKDESLLNIAKSMNSHISQEIVSNFISLFNEIGLEGIRELVYELISGKYINQKFFIESTNDYISQLANDLLEIKKSDEIVIDLGSGLGGFLANVYKNSYSNKLLLKNLIGIEINVEQAHISQMVLNILNDGSMSFKIIVANGLEKITYRYTKAYTFPPLGIKAILENRYRNSFMFQKVKLSNKNSTEWLFIDNLLSGLSLDRAVALVTCKALFSNSDLEYRNNLIKSGWLEGIIELPIGALSFTGIKMFLLVFSKGNKSVKFVDSSNVISSENKRYINLELPVKEIENMYYSNNVAKKTIEELIDVPNLCPSTILLNVKKFKNSVKLNDLAEVFTGNQYTLGVFEKKGLIASNNTGYRILTSSDIENGMVNWQSLQFITMNDDRFDKFAVKYGDVVVTSKSSKVKTVVVDIEPKEKILVTGGMIIVRPKTEKLNPTYLKMFLDSEVGQASLKSIQKGSNIVSITATSLSTIELPMVDINKQNEKASKYNAKLSTIASYKSEIERLENSLKHLFEEGEDY